MKNHFFIGYAGNKRNEVDNILSYIEELTNLNNIETIVEPFCGTSALSFFISTKYPKKFKYVLNDLDKNLIELYKIATDPQKLKKFNEELNLKVKLILNKEAYNLIKSENTFMSWFITHKIYAIKSGLYKLGYVPQEYNLIDVPIVHFLQTESITFSNVDGIEILKEYNDNDKAIIFLDPPYLIAENSFYNSTKTNIYEYLYHHNINYLNAFIVLVLEDNWIIKLLFKDDIKKTYNKLYQGSKKQTNHLLISNR